MIQFEYIVCTNGTRCKITINKRNDILFSIADVDLKADNEAQYLLDKKLMNSGKNFQKTIDPQLTCTSLLSFCFENDK